MKNDTEALSHFKNSDPVLYQAAIKFDLETLFKRETQENYFERLCRAIAGQQLSVKAASTIWGRFVELLPEGNIDPDQVVTLEHEVMRNVGLSNAKANYIRGIAEAVVSKQIDLEGLKNLENKEVISELTKLKGVGVWTAEMFLMSTLGREDIFSVGDLGLRRAMEKLYQLDKPTNETLINIAQKWSPYRTFACRVLWESLDNTPDR